MPASFINDPEHWRHRAQEARSIAEQMRLAERAEQRAKGSVQSR